MLTQTKAAPSRLVFQTQAVPAAPRRGVLALVIVLAIIATDGASSPSGSTRDRPARRVLFADWVLPFEIVGVLLLAAVIGGVFLAKRERGPRTP